MNIGADQVFIDGVLIAKHRSRRYGRDPMQWLGGENSTTAARAICRPSMRWLHVGRQRYGGCERATRRE
jgi:hypothetical protein